MRAAILISGRGSTMQALLDMLAIFPCTLVVSSKAEAPGLLRARRMGLQTLVLNKKIDYQALNEELKKRGIQRLFLAGFMRLLPDSFVKEWRGKIVNVHPSLLPDYPGLKAFETSYQDRSSMGASLHWVTEELDGGPLLQQICFHSKADWNKETPSPFEAQKLLSFTEQRLVREVVKVWK